MPKFSSVDDYIAQLPAPAQAMAVDLRAIIRDAAPHATEAIKYDMPAFQIRGSTFLYFACWKNHVGLYPVYRGDAAFEKAVSAFRAKKDTVQFNYDAYLPRELVTAIVQSQLASALDRA